jgi:uncharacterized protein YhjY with autotransporter beta-barrel domain
MIKNPLKLSLLSIVLICVSSFALNPPNLQKFYFEYQPYPGGYNTTPAGTGVISGNFDLDIANTNAFTQFSQVSYTYAGVPFGGSNFSGSNPSVSNFLSSSSPLDFSQDLVGQSGFNSFSINIPNSGQPISVNGDVATYFFGDFKQLYIYRLVSLRPETNSAVFLSSGLGFNGSMPSSFNSMSSTLFGDIGGRLFGMRAGGGEGGSSIVYDQGVTLGEGDGKETAKPSVQKATENFGKWNVYAMTNYANADLDATAAQSGTQIETWAPGLGIERPLNSNFTLGTALSAVRSDQHFSNNLGSLKLEGLNLSSYLSYVNRNFWIDGLYGFGAYDMETQRNPGGGQPTATGNAQTWTHSAQLNFGYNLKFQDDSLVTGPFAGIDYLHGAINAYNEVGGGAGALSVARQTFSSMTYRLGWSVSKNVETSIGRVTPQLSLSYERQELDNNGTSVSLLNVAASSTSNGQSVGRNYLVAGAGVSISFTPSLSLLVNYNGQFFREGMTAHFCGMKLNYSF